MVPSYEVNRKVLEGFFEFQAPTCFMFSFSLSPTCTCLSKYSLLLSPLVYTPNRIKLNETTHFFKMFQPRIRNKRSLLHLFPQPLTQVLEVTKMGNAFKIEVFLPTFGDFMSWFTLMEVKAPTKIIFPFIQLCVYEVHIC